MAAVKKVGEKNGEVRGLLVEYLFCDKDDHNNNKWGGPCNQKGLYTPDPQCTPLHVFANVKLPLFVYLVAHVLSVNIFLYDLK